ncbi:MAG TPA: pyridoxamine 5'-phosphate oxidase family protein [Acidimicrobiia bacterium]|nr:pyridoxamine 5'-phosphate oxidase family protein [Acidimicrobiia bacterium]
MLSESSRVTSILDRETIGFLTAVNAEGQPQTAPIWFVRADDDLIVYNHPTSPRIRSVESNPKVAFNVRGDIRGAGALLIEANATVVEVGPAAEFPGYLQKYEREIELFGWTPETFSADYSVALRLEVTRVRAWGLETLDR